jgi:hypothetical protein
MINKRNYSAILNSYKKENERMKKLFKPQISENWDGEKLTMRTAK